MLKHRVIPCLLLRDGGLVKTRKFAAPKYVGDPINAIRIFNEKEVDELIVLDIEASKRQKEPDYDLIERFAGECFMPLCYGGGITATPQAKRLFAAGVEKVSIQTSALENLRIISEIASRYGSQSVVVSLDIKKNWLGKYRLYSSARGGVVNQEWVEFMRACVAAGAGEILLNSVDRDGTLSGPDLELIRIAARECAVPLIAMGGTASLYDMRKAVDAGANAVAAGAFFVFHGPHRAVLITYPKYGELERVLQS
jgi:imidazole glycerol-phosphate synthase subunit HisF